MSNTARRLRAMAMGLPFLILAALPTGAMAQVETERATTNEPTLDDIVVTAQRRSENLQDVPLSVTAADAAVLDDTRVFNAESLNRLTPSVSFRKTNIATSSANIQIRGIGTVGTSRTFEGAVGVFVDGVYRSRAAQALSNFLDIDSLQILKGPQGTLFGKNTSAGAVLLTSTRPSTDRVEGNVEGSYGNYNFYLLRGAVNVPLSDKVALRVGAVQSDRNGFIRDPNGRNQDETKDFGAKAQLLIDPVDGLSIRLIGDFARSNGNCCYGTIDVVPGPLQGLIDGLVRANGLIVPSRAIADRQATTNPDPFNRTTDYGGTLQVDWEAGPGTLHSVTALRRYDLFQMQDADFSGASVLDIDETFKSKFFSQEFTYNGKLEGGLDADYLFGFFYSHERLTMSRTTRWGSQAQTFWDTLFAARFPAGTVDASPGVFGIENMGGRSISIAAFTHWEVKLSDRFSVIAGLRALREDKNGGFTQAYFRSQRDPLVVAGSRPGVDYFERNVNRAVTGTLGLQYRPSDDAQLYVTYNRGFKAGGVNLDVNGRGANGNVFGSPKFRPEKTDAFEAGLKVDWLNGRARTNAAAFYSKISDLQVAQFLGLQFVILNADGKSAGAEIDQTFRLSDAVTLSGSAIWLPTATFGVNPALGLLSGRRFSTAPEFSGNAAIDVEQEVSSTLAATGRVQVQYVSSVFTNPSNDLKQGGFALLNANLGVKSIGAGWQLEAWVQNLTNKNYITAHFNTPLQGTDRNAYLGEPRTYGVTARMRF